MIKEWWNKNPERQFKIVLLWTTPISFTMVILMKYDMLVERGFLIPLIVALPLGMFFSYLIYIRGIEDGLFGEKPKDHRSKEK